MLLIRLLSLLLPPLALFWLSWPASVPMAAWALLPIWLCVPLYGLLLSGSLSLVGAFIFGLAVDIVLHGTLGVWALGLFLPTLLLRLLQNRSLSQPFWVQLALVGIVVIPSHMAVFYWLNWLADAPLIQPWLPVIVAALLWGPLALLSERPEQNL